MLTFRDPLRSPRDNPRGLCCLIGVIFFLISSQSLFAHDPPEEYFDRNITITPEPGCVRARYRLEISQFSLFRLPDRDKQIDIRAVKDRSTLEAACLERFKTIIPDKLLVFLNDKALEWTVEKTQIEQIGSTHFHLRLRADWRPGPGENSVEIVDTNFEGVPGPYRLKIALDGGVNVVGESTELKDWLEKSVDPAREHKIQAVFRLDGTARPSTGPAISLDEGSANSPNADSRSVWQRLRDDDLTALLSTNYGLWLLMLFALIHGAGHSLMPGHGKTMVAAYLVGERGTPWHAVLLGIVTTLTHTSAAIAIAVLLRYGLGNYSPAGVNSVLMFLGGLTMLFVGVWLFLQRLAGRSDHVHLFDMGHGHSHGGEPQRMDRGGFVRLILLGIAGGIIPCWGAIMWVIGCNATSQFWLALPVVLAFSIGLAFVLIAIGLSVVYASRLRHTRVGQYRWFKRLFNERTVRMMPIVGAAVVVLIGLFMCAASGIGAH